MTSDSDVTTTAVTSPARRRPATGFRPDIEGLRAVAVLLVVLGHAGVPGLGGGYVGVDVFFVISGFLITTLLLREALTTGRVSISRFYARRAARLLPASSLVLVVTLAGSWLWLSPVRVRDVALDALAGAFYASNVRFAVTGTDYLNNDAAPSPFQHFWSLAVEEQFYLVWPVLIVLLLARRRLLVAALGVLVVASLVLSVTETQRSAPWAYFGAHTRIWELGAGAVLALLAPRLHRLPRRWAVAFGWLGLAAVGAAAVGYDESTPYPGSAATLPVAGTVLLIAAGFRRGGPGVGRLLGTAPMQHIGRLSYGWYLWHWPVLLIAPAALDVRPGPAVNLALCAGALGLAAATYRWVETPVRHRAGLRTRPARGIALGLGLSGGVAAAAAVVAGFPPAVPVGAAAPDLRAALTGAADPAAVLRDLVTAGDATTRLPRNATPPLATAARSVTVPQTDGCHLGFTQVRPAVDCAYGDAAARATVVLWGDSHALQWFPALDRLARERHWRLVSLTKSSCPPAALTITNNKLKRLYTECRAWQDESLARIAEFRPALLLVTSSVNYRRALADPTAADEQWRTGWDELFEQVRRSAGQVVYLVDTPTLPLDVLACLADRPAAVGSCAAPAADSLREPDWRAATADAARRHDVTVVDPNPWLCAHVCPAVLADTVVYRDANHLTAPMAEALAPALAAQLPRP